MERKKNLRLIFDRVLPTCIATEMEHGAARRTWRRAFSTCRRVWSGRWTRTDRSRRSAAPKDSAGSRPSTPTPTTTGPTCSCSSSPVPSSRTAAWRCAGTTASPTSCGTSTTSRSPTATAGRPSPSSCGPTPRATYASSRPTPSTSPWSTPTTSPTSVTSRCVSNVWILVQKI